LSRSVANAEVEIRFGHCLSHGRGINAYESTTPST
jgi:hypothetical protein